MPRFEGIERLVVIVGCQRSGTSLSGEVIGAHPNVLLIDETDGLMRWADALLAGSEEAEALYGPMLARAAEKYRRPKERVAERDGVAVPAPGITHLALKAPNLTYNAAQLAALDIPVSVIYPVRDPRSVVVSMAAIGSIDMVANQLERMKSDPAIAAVHAEDIAYIEDPATPMHLKRARVWRAKSTAQASFERAGLDPYVFRYEDFVEDAGPYTVHLANHAGLVWHEDMIEHPRVMRGQGPGLLNRNRGIDTRSVEKWRDRLSIEQERNILALCGEAMARLGYTPAPALRTPPAPRFPDDVLASPVIVTGKGGSGTRLISDIVAGSGVFLGNRLNKSSDSLEWVDMIYEMAIKAHAAHYAIDAREIEAWRRLFRLTADKILQKGRFRKGGLWGFKLPETVLAIPQLLDVFDNAKIVHLVRHPVTCCARRTHMTSRPDNLVGRTVCHAAYRAAGREAAKLRTDHDFMRNALTWLYQVPPVARLGRQLGPDRYLEVRFEDIIGQPDIVARKVRDFLGDGAGLAPAPEIDDSRTSFAIDPEWEERIWAVCGDAAREIGYSRSFDCQGDGQEKMLREDRRDVRFP